MIFFFPTGSSEYFAARAKSPQSGLTAACLGAAQVCQQLGSGAVRINSTLRLTAENLQQRN